MQELLYLVHRIPYPPNKGDKIRSYHLLKHLSQRYRVHLGAFIDDENDWQYVDQIKPLCAEINFVKLTPMRARLKSLSGLFTNDPLTLRYYRNAQMQAWVNQILCVRQVKHVLIFSSSMAQYVNPSYVGRCVIDFVDVDSDKWRQYAVSKPWPISWLYQRESNCLLNYEKRVTADFDSATFVSQAEAALFQKYAPEMKEKVSYFNNGVDAEYFSPHATYQNPYPDNAPVLVFTGAMDYWANVEAVDWFSHAVFPLIRQKFPTVKFAIVGTRPTAQVTALADLPGIVVTGSVPDIRPFLAHAALAVAPLRIARGVQNKVLEAMAMEKIVIATPQAVEGIHAIAGQELLVAHGAQEFASHITTLLATAENKHIGSAARARILKDYDWENNLRRVDALLQPDSNPDVNVVLNPELKHNSQLMTLLSKSA